MAVAGVVVVVVVVLAWLLLAISVRGCAELSAASMVVVAEAVESLVEVLHGNCCYLLLQQANLAMSYVKQTWRKLEPKWLRIREVAGAGVTTRKRKNPRKHEL